MPEPEFDVRSHTDPATALPMTSMFWLDWREVLRANELSAAIIDQFEADVGGVAADMVAATRQSVPELASAPEVVLLRVLAHCEDHARTIVTIVKGGRELPDVDFDFVRENARIRARETFPLAALLHGYRMGHRAVWARLCGPIVSRSGAFDAGELRTILAFSTFSMDYANTISNIAADAYADERRHLGRITDHAKGRVLEGLLAGSADGATVVQARTVGLQPTNHHAVVVIETVEQGPVPSDTFLLDAARRVEDLLAARDMTSLLDLRRDRIVGIVAGEIDVDDHIADTLRRSPDGWMGEANFHVGISSTRQGLEGLDLAYRDAGDSLDHASAGRPVVCFSEVGMFDHLIATADPSSFRIRAPWMDAFIAEDERQNGKLLLTLRTYLDCHLSAKATATRLEIHPNTVYQRLKKIEDVTGQLTTDARSLLNLITLLAVRSRPTRSDQPPAP